MKNSITMLDAICKEYRGDASKKQIVNGIKCIFVSDEELILFYKGNGFNMHQKYTALDRHLEDWEDLRRAQKTVINGISGALIQIKATA